MLAYVLSHGHYKVNFLIDLKSPSKVQYEFFKIPAGDFRGYALVNYDKRKGYSYSLNAFYPDIGNYFISSQLQELNYKGSKPLDLVAPIYTINLNTLKVADLDLVVNFSNLINISNFELNKFIIDKNKILLVFSNYDEKYKFMNVIGYFIIDRKRDQKS